MLSTTVPFPFLGGGAVAALIAMRRNDVIWLKTVAAPVVEFGPALQTLADDLGLSTAVLDPIESQTDASKDYAATMNSNIDALTKALDCQ